MKERPILFSAPMVRAILAGDKTQTRRVVKPQPYVDAMGNACWKGWNYGQTINGTPRFDTLASPIPDSRTKRVLCPFGKPGDRLWVRETWFDCLTERTDAQRCTREEIYYRADGTPCFEGEEDLICWRSSIHMPRWASRLVLEITEVRVHRLQDISQDDAYAEGFQWGEKVRLKGGWDKVWTTTPLSGFRDIWEKLHGADAWAQNPWVWAITFKRAEGEA